MSYWDTSALLKLSVAELDSAQFQQFAGTAARIVTAVIGRFAARTVFRRREAEGRCRRGKRLCCPPTWIATWQTDES